jgi:hypothetical protein
MGNELAANRRGCQRALPFGNPPRGLNPLGTLTTLKMSAEASIFGSKCYEKQVWMNIDDGQRVKQ